MRRKAYHIPAKLIVLLLAVTFGKLTVFGQAPVANFTGTPLAGCSPVIVSFTDQSTGSPTTWNWNFGNSNTSTLQNPSATYFTPGTYTVTLTVGNASGTNTLTRTQYVTVYEPPTGAFTADNTSGCFPLRVQFSDLSNPGAGNTNTGWQWDFGNGVTSTQQNPFISYTTAGAFTVTLKVTNDKGCIKTVSIPNYINVTAGVTASFTNTQPTVCSSPADITFTNTSTGPGTLTYQWNFGDAGTSTTTSPIHTYVGNGNYTATLVTTSSAGCVDTFRNVAPIVVGGFVTSFTAPASVCTNEVVAFTNTSVPTPASANWAFGDATTGTGINTTHSYSTAGTYVAWVYNNYGSCIDSTSQSIQVNPRPVANFTAPVTSQCAPPLTVNFQDISTGAISWKWDFGDGNTSITQNPVHTYTSYGSFTVTLIATNNFGCTDTIIKPAYINIKKALITVPGLPTHGCISFTINPVPSIISVDAITSYRWEFGDGGISTVANPSHTYIAQGTYTILLIITTSSGCRDTLTIPAAVRVGSKPLANFTGTPTPVCARQPVQFTDLSVPADQWEWDFGDGSISTLQNPIHKYQDTGYFTVQLIASNNGCPDTIVKTNYIYVLPPIARFTNTPNCNNRLQFTFTDQSIGPITTYKWDFGDGATSGTQNPVHVYPSLGSYTVTLVVTNGGCSDTTIQTVQTVQQSPDFFAVPTTVCRNVDVLFTLINFNGALTTGLSWDFGDGTVASTGSPNIGYAYPNSGSYNVVLTVTDINGCSDVITKNNYIRVNGPVSGLSATNTMGCTGLKTTFNDLTVPDGINALTNWHFDFGDGVIQNFSAPPFTHTYNLAGTFTVKMKVTDASGCSDSTTLIDTVTTSDPTPNFISADTLSCPNSTVTFTNTTVATPFTSQWFFGDGAISNSLSPTHNYTAQGFYNVKLRIVDQFGCADSITKNMFVRVDTPMARFTASDSISSCIPLEIQFTNTSTYIIATNWDFGTGQGNSTLNNPIHFYSAPGIYIVKLYVTSPGGCIDSAYKTIQVYDTVGSVVNYLPLNGCKPLSVNLNTFSPGPMASYLWDFGDGYTQTTTTPNVNHLYASFGNFLPKVILQDPAGCIIPLQGPDTILATGANPKFGFDKSLLCDMGPISFTDSTTFNDPVSTYTWQFGDGTTSPQQNPVHQYTSPGHYDVKLIVQTQLGCIDSISKVNAVTVIQRPLIDIVGDDVICVNSPLLTGGIFIQPDTSVVTWSWTFPNGNTFTQQNPPAQFYTTGGNFTITAIATNSSGCKDTTTQDILVNPLPVVTMPGQIIIQSGFPVLIPATYSPNTLTWVWSPSQGLSCTDCPTPIAGPKFNTTYQVYFTDENNCSNTGKIEVLVICKDANLFMPNTFSPNGDGSNDIFYPRGKGLERVRSLRILNRWGEIVFDKREFPVNDPNSGWDGTFKGKKPQADVYVYQLEVFCGNGEIIKLNGNIALIL